MEIPVSSDNKQETKRRYPKNVKWETWGLRKADNSC